MTTHLSQLLDIKLDFDSSNKKVREFNTLLAMMILRAIFKLSKTKIAISKGEEIEINFLTFLSSYLKQKIKTLQTRAEKPCQPYMALTLDELYKQLIASVEKFKENNEFESAFIKQLLENVSVVNQALSSALSLTITPKGEAEYFKLIEPFQLDPLEKKKLMFRIIDMINSGAIIESLEPTEATPIIELENLITFQAEFRNTNN